MKLFCRYEKYERYYSGGIKNVWVEGKDSLECIKKLVDKMTLYLDSDIIEEENLSFEDCIERIEESNGDGCDMIILLKDDRKNTYIDDTEMYKDIDYEEHDDQDFDENDGDDAGVEYMEHDDQDFDEDDDDDDLSVLV